MKYGAGWQSSWSNPLQQKTALFYCAVWFSNHRIESSTALYGLIIAGIWIKESFFLKIKLIRIPAWKGAGQAAYPLVLSQGLSQLVD
jgi:hypothetical protein